MTEQKIPELRIGKDRDGCWTVAMADQFGWVEIGTGEPLGSDDLAVVGWIPLVPAPSEQTTDYEAAVLEEIENRDRAIEWADKLAAAIAPPDVLGEHSNGNDPWQNALDYAGCRPSEQTTPTTTEQRDLIRHAYLHVEAQPQIKRQALEQLMPGWRELLQAAICALAEGDYLVDPTAEQTYEWGYRWDNWDPDEGCPASETFCRDVIRLHPEHTKLLKRTPAGPWVVA